MDLDIIIPAYNAHETIERTIESIVNQKNADGYKVYVVNDCSDNDYSNIINRYSNVINIAEIKTEINGGPGLTRNYGLDNSKGKYVMFIDSDDYLYDNNSLKKLYDAITENESVDMVISSFIYERDGQRIVKKENPVWLHGKVYKRSFLDKYSIRFNSSSSNEDNGFNRLVLFMNPNLKIIDDITYVYSENPNSITRRNNRLFKFEGLEGLAYNITWAIKEAIKRNANEFDIVIIALNTITAMYFYYNELYNEYDVSKILGWSKDILDIYKQHVYLLPNEAVNTSIETKKSEYKKENKNIELIISFEDFLNKINDVL